MAWYEKTIEETLQELETSASAGISGAEAGKRRAQYGTNETGNLSARSLSVGNLGILVVPPVILAVVAVICLLLGQTLTAIVTFAAAVIVAALRAYSMAEIRRVLGSVTAVTAPMTTVVRDGVPEIVETTKLVPGDLVQLRAGDIAGADMRLVETMDLVMDESILPGGFMGALKDASTVFPEDMELSRHQNMCYTGTVVRSGSGRAVVVATGNKIAAPFAVRPPYEYEHRSLLNRTIAKQNRRAAIVGAVCCGLLLVCSLLVQTASLETLSGTILNVLALFAALIPVGLSLTEAVLSASGIRRLALSGTMVKSLDTMARLSSLSTILAQKTGAIASDEMTVTHVWTGGRLIDVRGRGYAPDGRFLDADGHDIDPRRNRSLALTLIGGALCGDSDIEEKRGKWSYRGDPTEAALVTLAAKAGLLRTDMLTMFPRVAEFPFEPERRRMTTVHKRGRQEAVAYTKGAPATVLERCTAINFGGETYPITDQTREQLAEVVRRLTEQGLRLLAVAYREFPEMPARFEAEDIEQELVFAGLCGIDNRASRAAVAAYNLCAASGIRTVLVSGDDASTTADLALSMGISGDVLTGPEIAELSPEELREKLKTVRVFAQVTPEEKRTLITELKRLGGITAATGTRAADAPTLIASDIGISIGENASELTRDRADIVSEKAGYAGLVRAVEESRRKFLSLRAYCGFAYAAAAAVLYTVLALLLATPPVTVSLLHLVWIGVFLALIPAFVIGNDPGERDVMRRPPLTPGISAYGPLTVVSSLIQGLLPAVLTVVAFFLAKNRGMGAGLGETEALACGRTAVFVTLTLSLLALAHAGRSAQTGIQRLGLFSNRALTVVSAATVIVLLASVLLPFLHEIFDTTGIGVVEWLFALLAALLSLVWSELYKSLLRPLLARVFSDTVAQEQDIPEDASLIDRLFARFSGGDPTQEEELSRRQRQKKAARKAEEAAAAARAGVVPPETPELTEAAEPAPQEAEAEVPAYVPEEELPQEEAPEDTEDAGDAQDPTSLDHVLSALPDELMPYADIIANLPPELLEGGLPGRNAEDSAEAAEELLNTEIGAAEPAPETENEAASEAADTEIEEAADASETPLEDAEDAVPAEEETNEPTPAEAEEIVDKLDAAAEAESEAGTEPEIPDEAEAEPEVESEAEPEIENDTESAEEPISENITLPELMEQAETDEEADTAESAAMTEAAEADEAPEENTEEVPAEDAELLQEEVPAEDAEAAEETEEAPAEEPTTEAEAAGENAEDAEELPTDEAQEDAEVLPETEAPAENAGDETPAEDEIPAEDEEPAEDAAEAAPEESDVMKRIDDMIASILGNIPTPPNMKEVLRDIPEDARTDSLKTNYDNLKSPDDAE